ncbi:ATP-binding protein [Stenotrophomonas maltophilia]|uniref:ATP-binding protein n=1 Tax=Stenotrophomonas maltophilia TaxID=40324 RepID=UPI0021BF96E2|nr:ATP-binding protein [Stenotrophomonas maltophilia]UXL29532.1 ATP-binding protein [Stenotrophomonas maltophilia]
MNFPVIPQNLSISAMRSSGYRDTAHALAEIIDNSIQAGDGLEGRTEVEVICIEDQQPSGRRQISKIAVFDNACGMDSSSLRQALQFGNGSRLEKSKQNGIGKFGMGLPNSSISQCRRLDVWTWRDGNVLHAYIDVNEISKGIMTEVPAPKPDEIPQEWSNLIACEIGPHGTLVVWSDLDRTTWKQSTTLLRHTEFISGRAYRHFINDQTVRIRLAAYEAKSNATIQQCFVRANDPLYLMVGANAPAPYDVTPAFVPFCDPVRLEISHAGALHPVTIVASICKRETRNDGGGTSIGQHAQKNQGISVVRAKRELELNTSFTSSYDTRERWWGIEVLFEPGLDDVFGVTNNKQSATGFTRLSLEEDAAEEKLTTQEYKDKLEAESDPRLAMYYISREIEKLLTAIRPQVLKMREGTRASGSNERAEAKAEKAASQSVARRRGRIGDTGQSDKEEGAPVNERTSLLAAEILQDGVDKAKAEEIAVDYVKKKIKFRFKHGAIPPSHIFDVSTLGGVILITLNTRHPVHESLFHALLEENVDSSDLNHARQILSLIAAWARLEDEAPSEKMRQSIEDVRMQWGRMAMDFFESEA